MLGIIALPLVSVPVFACSLSPDYKGPETNFELVQQADVIFIGRLVRSVGGDAEEPMIIVKPQKLLKGAALPEAARITGYLSDRIISDGGKRFKASASPSDPFDIWRPHSEVWSGGCSRYSFNQNAQVVLFFKNIGGKLEWFDPAFARGAEDVLDDEALWVRAVKLYANISQLPGNQQRPALVKEMMILRSVANGDSMEALLADDIERQLSGCGPVSDFVLSNSPCSKSRWVYNIANVDFARKVEPQTFAVKAVANGKNRVGWIVYAISFSSMAALGLVAFFGWRRRRKTNMSS